MDPQLRDRWLEHANQRLSEVGRRAGAARTALLEVLAREGQCLLSVHEMVELLGGTGSAASVYRTVDDLHGLGLLRRFDGGDGVARYEIAGPHDDHHHHFVDDQNGQVEAFTDEALERAIAGVAERLDIELTGHDVVLRGRRR